MSRPRFALLVLALASVLCLGDMRGDDAPKTTKGNATTQPPDRLLKAISGKGTKARAAVASKPAEEKPAAKEPVAEAPKEAKAAEDVPAEKQPAAKAAVVIKPAKLTPKQINLVKNELLPAFQAGEPLTLLNLVSSQMPRWTDPQIAGMNQLLGENDAPTLDRIVTDVRMNLIRAGVADSGPEYSAREAAIVLRELKRQADEIVAQVEKLELMKDPLVQPKSLTEFRDLLWVAHVQNNQLINASGLAHQGKLLTQAKVVTKARSTSAADKAIFATDFQKLFDRIKALHQEINERAVELRVARVKFAVQVLTDSKDVKERFFAAYAVGIDGELLLNGFKEHQGPFGREALNAPGYSEALQSDVDRGKKLAGDLVKKSHLLVAGMHWWRRGRYGRGPELNGLLKSKEAQTNLAAQIPLLMPKESPVPVDPAKNPFKQTPDYDRRHHYTWAWQTRQFEIISTSGGSSSSSTDSTSTSSVPMTMTPDFWKGKRFL